MLTLLCVSNHYSTIIDASIYIYNYIYIYIYTIRICIYIYIYVYVIFDLERGSGKAWLRYLATHFYFCRMAGAWDLIGRGTEAGKMMFLGIIS